MQFTHYNKAIVATVMALLSIGSLVFHTNLGVYADLITGILTATTPVLVYAVPNAAKKLADGGDFETYEDVEAKAAETLGGLVKPTV